MSLDRREKPGAVTTGEGGTTPKDAKNRCCENAAVGFLEPPQMGRVNTNVQ